MRRLRLLHLLRVGPLIVRLWLFLLILLSNVHGFSNCFAIPHSGLWGILLLFCYAGSGMWGGPRLLAHIHRGRRACLT